MKRGRQNGVVMESWWGGPLARRRSGVGLAEGHRGLCRGQPAALQAPSVNVDHMRKCYTVNQQSAAMISVPL